MNDCFGHGQTLNQLAVPTTAKEEEFAGAFDIGSNPKFRENVYVASCGMKKNRWTDASTAKVSIKAVYR